MTPPEPNPAVRSGHEQQGERDDCESFVFRMRSSHGDDPFADDGLRSGRSEARRTSGATYEYQQSGRDVDRSSKTHNTARRSGSNRRTQDSGGIGAAVAPRRDQPGTGESDLRRYGASGARVSRLREGNSNVSAS
jgi:hypothetical protein